MVFVDLLLYSEEKITTLEDLLVRHQSNLGYVQYIPSDITCHIIQRAGFSIHKRQNNVVYEIYKGKNQKWHIPFQIFLKLRKLEPDVVLVHSMVYAWQILFLKMFLHKKTQIIVQNHAEKPSVGLRRYIETAAAGCIDHYLFVTKEQTTQWVNRKIIDLSQIKEMMEGSTYFKMQRSESGDKLRNVFLWVGRLDDNKDPMTVLKAFAEYIQVYSDAKLIMVYNSGTLEEQIKNTISSRGLSNNVELLGSRKHHELEKIYNDADYFVLGSYYEGSGYALCEAMACGCIPIVTKIPSFTQMTDNGDCGYLFDPGDSDNLFSILLSLKNDDYLAKREKVLRKFKKDLSFSAIAKTLEGLIRS